MRAAVAAGGNDRALITRRCPQCDGEGERIEARYSVDAWRIVQCATCGFVYLKDVPAYERLVEELAWEKTFSGETERRRRSYPLVSFIERTTRWRLFLLPGKRARLYRSLFNAGRVLDVGCATGHAVPEPLVPFGIEISQALAREADARMSARGGRAVCAPALEGIAGFPDRYFSGVILSSILEHEMNPKPLLRQVARVLADGGKVYVRVPNYGSINRRVMGRKWCGFRYPDHVNYFTTRSLRAMVSECGLRMQLIGPLALPFNDNINAVLAKS
jgi:SAM-dependent methyltransferase